MGKLSIGLNVLTIIVSVIGLIITQLSVTDYEQKLENIETIKQAIADGRTKLDQQKKETMQKLLGQKNRNEVLVEKINQYKADSAAVLLSLDQTKTQISDLEGSIKEINSKMNSSGEREKQAFETLKQEQSNVETLRSEIPQIQRQIDVKRLETRDFDDRADELLDRLSIYAKITAVLRQHYLDTMSSIRAYARERPWIESGEELHIQLGPFDLVSGYVAISEGGADGLRENMVFSIRSAGEEISKIRIKKVFRTHSLAEIIPLVGNPLKLESIKEVDLVAL